MAVKIWLKDEHKLPSWVPDRRRSEGIVLAEAIRPHRAHGNSSTTVEILEEDYLVLRVQGMEIDTIKACSRRLTSADLYGKKTPDQPMTMIEQLWHKVCTKERFNLDDIYRYGQTTFFAFMLTLSNGCVQAAGHNSVPYHEVPDGVWLRKTPRYIVKTYGASDDVS